MFPRGFQLAIMFVCLALSAGVTSGSDTQVSNWVPAPHSTVLELSKTSPSATEADGQATSEENIEIRRPESSAGIGSLNSGKRLVQRREQQGASWKFWGVVPLAAVLVVIVGVALLIKRFMPGRRLLTGSGVLEIVARTPLSGKQSLVLVKMGRRLVMLGVSPDRVNSLSVVDDPEQVSLLMGEIASGRGQSSKAAFANSLEGEQEAYTEEFEEDLTRTATGQVRGLLNKVRRMTVDAR